MSTMVKYDGTKFDVVRRRDGVNRSVRDSMASFSVQAGYSEDEVYTLLMDSVTATLVMTWWDDDPRELDRLRIADEITASYDGHLVFHGAVDAVDVSAATDVDALMYGKSRKMVMTATLVGDYALAMGRVNKKSPYTLPTSAAQRAREFATFTNIGAAEEADNQMWNQAVEGVAVGTYFAAIDALRAVSTLMFSPIRFNLDGTLSVVDAATEPFLPDGIEASEGGEMFTETTWKSERPPHYVIFTGNNVGTDG